MPFISKENIPDDVRIRGEKVYKGVLRQSLINPGLTAEQKERILNELRKLGEKK
jgi:hypothetical protein